MKEEELERLDTAPGCEIGARPLISSLLLVEGI